jgi:ATP-dependent DNA helicase RecG
MLFDGESKIVEYKQEYSNTILKTVCAYANFHDGYIIIGIKDDNSVVGIENIDEIKLGIENAINDSIIPKPYYEFEVSEVDDKNLLIIKVYKGDYTPYVYKNRAYMRRDTSTIQVDRQTHENLILAGRNLGFEDLPSEEQSLSFKHLEVLLKKNYQITELTIDLLKTLGLMEQNVYNKAAELISDENPLDSSVIQLVAFHNTSVNRIKDRMTVRNCSVLNQFDECMSFYKKHINIGEVIDSAYRRTIEEVPYVAYREAVANMLVHRDYSINVDSRIEIFSDRIEIISPGGLPIGLMTEEYLEGRISKPRNRKIVDIFLRLKIIEKLATGIRRIKSQYADYNVKPKFIVGENSVVVVLPKVDEGVGDLDIQNNIGDVKLVGRELAVYKLIQDKPSIKRAEIQDKIHLEKSQTIEIINKLRNLGLIIKVGNGPATGYRVVE